MPISWPAFENSIRSYARGDQRGKTVYSFASWFTALYDTTMRSGGDSITQGPVLVGNVAAMQSVLISGMQSGFAATQLGQYNWMLTCGAAVQAYWTGAQLALIPGPWGLPVSNMVVSPGVFPPTNTYIAYSIDPFITTLVANMRAHLATLQGVVVSVVGFTVIPFPWIGYL